MGQRISELLAAGAIIGVTAAAVSCATVAVPQLGPTADRAAFLRRGQHVFATNTLVGPGGTSCAGCHENDVPFENHSLARRYYDLDELIRRCLRQRTLHVPNDDTDAEARALREFVIYRYVFEGAIADENPEGIVKLGETMDLFLTGDYESALSRVREARELVVSERNKVQSLALEACIHLFQLDEAAARAAFTEALRLNPEVRIDGYVFSPKILAVLEDVRARFER